MIKKSFYIIPLLLSALNPVVSYSQTNPLLYDYSQNHLDWFTIESDHFLIHFQEGNSRSAKVVARISEEIYGPITELYQHVPDEKVSIVLKDRDDYSNGAAYFFDNKIDIWLPALDTPLRGTHNWLRNVISHEFVHIVQIQVGMKRKRKFPISYVQWLSYENVRRPDVLYGFPNGIATLPFASINIPAWLAEGTAQYQRSGLLYDTWDSHRDMILRTRILSDTYFSLDEMGTFSSKTSLERETVYNQGFAFVIYLVNRFGEDVLRELTEALATKGTYNVAEGIEIATGISGYQVFEDWINERKTFYADAVSGINPTASSSVEKEGFFNFYPKSSPDNNSLAYLSNKGRDYSAVSLYLKETGESKELAILSNKLYDEHLNHADAVKPSIPFINNTFSFSPEGKHIAYSVNKNTKYGESYRDIFIYSTETEKHERVTKGARIESPAWHPSDKKLAVLAYNKGTQNLALLDPETHEVQQLTDYKNGETFFTPVWSPDGEEIYFAFADFSQRRIMKYKLATKSVEAVLEDEFVDYRDPFLTADGNYLYYSANPDGIFNIYRILLADGEPQKLTSVIGGAFMPFATQNGELYFSEYEATGYKIKKANLKMGVDTQLGYYEPQIEGSQLEASQPSPYIENLNDFDDTDLNAFTDGEKALADKDPYNFSIEAQSGSEELTYRPYSDTYTKFSFFPVVRFDNYTKLNGNNGTLIKNGRIRDFGENLLRDVKPGVYFTSRDMIDRLSIFGGIMMGVGSRPAESLGEYIAPNNIIEMDRDIFLIAEHRGLPFIKRSWSPTVSIELFNLHRNVDDGLLIEEFTCTSCPEPDTARVDIAYEIWEASLFLRSKLSRRSLLEFGIGYSPYRIQTDNFFSQELQALIPGSSSEYFKGTRFSAAYTFNYYEFTRDADIAPTGLKGYLRYEYEPSKLLEEYEIDDGALKPIFKTTRNHSTELHVRYGFKFLNGQAFQARARGFTYFNNTNDAFFSDFIGGFLGMRSYPYFALAGEQTAFTSLSWFLPIKKRITKQVGPYTIDKLYTRFFFETGNAWQSPFNTGNNLKTGVGAELRLAMNGYYLFPLKFFISGSYGFNQFTLTLPEEFITGSQNNKVTYGRELLFHFGLTFDFELL